MFDDRRDRLVGQLLDVQALLVAEQTPGVGFVEQLLELDVRHRADELEQRRESLPDLSRDPHVLLCRTESGEQQRVAGLEVVLLGDERSRRRVQTGDHRVEVVRKRRNDLPSEPQHFRSLVELPEEHS